MRTLIAIAVGSLFAVPAAAQVATCRANLVAYRGQVIQTFLGYGYDIRLACQNAQMKCQNELDWRQSTGSNPYARCEIVRGPRPGPQPDPWPDPRPDPRPGNFRDVVCESNNYNYRECYVGRDIVDVRILRQFSNSQCRRGETWGFRRGADSIWVSGGCRANFRVSFGRY